jgi:alpha-aminoadipate/glutamate carrier protein LysW
MVTCPECDSQIDIDEEELDEGDMVSCEECGAALRVVGVDPLELEPADDEDEEEQDDLDEGGEDEHWH